jgi:tetratricopeptide (TPR) repeat protein
MSTTRQSLNKLKLESSYSFNREAIKIYREVLDGYPKLPNRDEVYFYLAYNLGEVGENKQAQNYYNALINTYPNSKYVPEAYLVQAEYYFYDDKFQPALDTYKKVLKYKGSEVYDLAVYKIAWCYFNLSNISLALKTMEQIAEGEQKTATELDLREEALRDIVVIFAYGGYHKEAPFYFKQIGGAENYRPMIKRLAGIYFAQGKNGYADELYKRLINEDPGDKENPEFRRRLVDIAKRLGRKEDVIIEASKLVRFYSDESKWSAKNKNDKAISRNVLSERSCACCRAFQSFLFLALHFDSSE